MDHTDADEVSAEDNGIHTPNSRVEESTRHRLKCVAQVNNTGPSPNYLPIGRRDARADASEPTTHSHLLAHSQTRANCPAGLWERTLPTHQTLYPRVPRVGRQSRPAGCARSHARMTELIIAKKLLGNADESQEEMVHFAVEGARKGFSQADLSIYDHSSEETLFFRTRGFEPLLISCISSALARPTFVGIPLTHGSVVVWEQGTDAGVCVGYFDGCCEVAKGS
ncbi:uncharacterized protein LACBIDRAFT_306663 [Laccaria bicolor S238N-H82]|uniref:Predicted protein n=1 Tax=Laccaria bicolor (strain S238N-H82 / ATCC MYA-4686) TaxID=486041 RepID=B0DNI5_LACBS|nr:uncharacterized protein LACBIDRAFT_306663 [Laccaria bicolor S238N-H82]EDR03944.1 predicted protein [Laccaria bicolor S238N-H82]|eukprot:XP_001885512.1 predicted protein [Laccaria bicolor S238N-H82]